MANSSRWKDIDEKFCLCSICLEQLKEPKQLPCLHRYCKDCLNTIIQRNYDVINCPECREEIQIPTNGVDGFKTDFYSKSLVEYVQIQQSLNSEEIRECFGCSILLRIAAYCFKCNGSLCKDCHNFHVTNKMMKDHQKHTVSLKDTETKNITIEKLASMRAAPSCHTHPEKIAELYCETCNNLPACMACMLGEHEGHNLHEMKALARLKRKDLAQKLKALEEIEKGNMLITTMQKKDKLISNVSTEKEKVMKMFGEKDQKILTKIHDIERRIQQVKQERQNSEKKIFESLQKEMENEIQRVKKRYEEIFKVKQLEITCHCQAQERSLEKELAELRKQRDRFDEDKKKVLESMEQQLNEYVKVIETISDHFDNIKERFETLNIMASSVLDSDNDWSAVQCIPDLCRAATNLMKELKKIGPELSIVTDVKVNYKQCLIGRPSATNISEQVIKFIPLKTQYKYVCGVTSSGDGNIVLSGYIADKRISFIIVIDMNGWILKEKKLKSGNYRPVRYCKYLSQHKVASVCEPNEIGLYDVRDGSYIKRGIKELIPSWPIGRYVRCAATDPVNNHILVGGLRSRDLYLFDAQLIYLHIITLPEFIKWPQDIALSDGHLLVCDSDGKKSYVTIMDGLESKQEGEFKKANLEGNNFKPISVCTDNKGFVYMLWKKYIIGYTSNQCYLVQYSHDGSQVLTTRKLDGDAQVVTVVDTSQGEKLVVATSNTNNRQAVNLYDLITEY